MLTVRLTQLKNSVCDLCFKIANDHFAAGEKERTTFIINNLDYIYQSLKNLNLEKGIQDVIALEKELNKRCDDFIKVLLKENFPSLSKIVSKYVIDNSSEENDEQ